MLKSLLQKKQSFFYSLVYLSARSFFRFKKRNTHNSKASICRKKSKNNIGIDKFHFCGINMVKFYTFKTIDHRRNDISDRNLYLPNIGTFKPYRFNNQKKLQRIIGGNRFRNGVALPVIISDLSITTWLPSVTLFCLICWANCKLIENWESNYMRFSKTDIILIMFLFCCMFFSKNYFVVASIISMTSFLMLNNFIGSKIFSYQGCLLMFRYCHRWFLRITHE